MREFINITKALADPNRLRVLLCLRRNELCLCQIIEMLGLAPSTVSKHMTILWQARLVECRKEGRWRYYRIPRLGKDLPKPVRQALKWVSDSLGETADAQRDEKRLRSIMTRKKEALCVRYKC